MMLFFIHFQSRDLDFSADCTSHPLVSLPHFITFIPCQSYLPHRHHLHRLPSTPMLIHHCATPLSHCNICLSFEMKRKGLPVGSRVAHPEGWLRLMPAIQLCWFTPRTHRGLGDYTVLCWRGRRADRQKWETGTEGGRERGRMKWMLWHMKPCGSSINSPFSCPRPCLYVHYFI